MLFQAFNIVFLLCARVGLCDVCTDFTNVTKVDDVNNSDGKASLKRQKSPETTTDTQFSTESGPKLPLNNIFYCGLAANNTTCVCVLMKIDRNIISSLQYSLLTLCASWLV